MNLRMIEYQMLAILNVRVFVEKKAHRNPMQEKLDAAARLERKSSVLGAINEWQTWFVVDTM